jgi:hypothetical protein
MSVKTSTESADVFFVKASGDIKSVSNNIYKEVSFDIDGLNNSSFDAHHAVEKLLKGYLAHCRQTVVFGHNIDLYWDQANNINKSFESIRNDVAHINQFGAIIEYSTNKQPSYDDLSITLKGLKNIYHHPAIYQSIQFYSQNNKCELLPTVLFDDMINIFQRIKLRDENREISCFSAESFDKYDDSITHHKNSCLDRIYKLNGMLPDNAIKGRAEKLVYEDDEGNYSFFLRIKYKIKDDEQYRADVYELSIDFSQKQAEKFIKDYRNWEKQNKINKNNKQSLLFKL